MKKIIATAMSVLMLLTLLPLAAFSLSANGFTYQNVDGKAVITDYTGASGSVSIPSTLGGLSVSAIGDYAFAEKGISSVTFPSTLVSIGNGAFSSNASLSSVSIPANVTYIGNGCFNSCVALTTVTIPSASKLQTIGAYAFYNNHKLTNIAFPGSLKSIGQGAFSYCIALKTVTIPENVNSIGAEAFLSCHAMTSATIYSRNVSIGDLAFDLTNNNGALTINGYKNSTAQTFASRNSFSFTALPEVTSIDVNKTSFELKVGETGTITAVAKPTSLGKSVKFTSADTSVATVNANGLVTARSKGNTEIICSADLITVRVSVTVLAPLSVKMNFGSEKLENVKVNIYNSNDAVVYTKDLATAYGSVEVIIPVMLNTDTYRITVSKPGYLSSKISNIVFNNSVSEVNISRTLQLRPGDVNNDEVINIVDISEILISGNYGKLVTDAGVNSMADVNGDGYISVTDIAIIMQNDNFSASAQSISL